MNGNDVAVQGRVGKLLRELEREYVTLEQSLARLFSSQSVDSEDFHIELRLISGRLQALQPRYQEAVSLWQAAGFRPTQDNIQLRKRVQEVLQRVLQQVEQQQLNAESAKSRLLPELNVQARTHRAESAYQRTSRTT